MDLRLRTRLLVPAALVSVWFLSSASWALASTTVYAPVAVNRAEVGTVPPLPLPSCHWSKVLNDVPVPIDYDLRFFDSDSGAAVSVAQYVPASSDADEPGAWYREVLPVLGWSPVRETSRLQQWNRGGRRLDIRLPYGEDTALRIECRPDCPRSADGWDVGRVVSLPESAVRLRFDPVDTFLEEVMVASITDTARSAVRASLVNAGWRSTSPGVLAGTPIDRFVRGEDRILVAAWPAGHESSRVGIGWLDCLAANEAWPDWPQPDAAAYVANVEAPSASHVVAFSPDERLGSWTETWHSLCLDLDLSADVYTAGMGAAGWSAGGRVRTPGQVGLTFRHGSDGAQVDVALEAVADGVVTTSITTPTDGVQASQGASRLFADLPLPIETMPVRLEAGRGRAWPIVELYVPPEAAVPGLAAFHRQYMPEHAWTFDRLEPAEVGPSQVYFGGGEEVSIGFPNHAEDVPAISLSRRRICPSDEVIVDPGDGLPATHMDEMWVFPGAVLDRHDAGGEHYMLTCASLDVLVAWYRGVMESADWALASTIGPEDAHHRELLFVRPAERALPPEERTAWATVSLERPWPYTYRFALLRDPTGTRSADDAR